MAGNTAANSIAIVLSLVLLIIMFYQRRGTQLRWMMFLEYAVWGAWSPILSAYLGSNLHFTGNQIGWIYAMLPLATILSPMLFGQIADRYVPTQWLLSGLNLASAILLWFMAGVHTYVPFLILMFLYSLVFAPTLVLTNSISFSHLEASEKEFGLVRVGGTIGWMVAGYALTLWMSFTGHSQGDSLQIAAICALALSVFSLTLPHTPPRREGADPLAFLKALKLLQDRNFLIFIVISFVVATELMFYYVLTAPFLEHLRVKPENTSMVLTIAQGAELVVVGFLLPIVLPKWGVRKVMVIGILAWPLRYLVFALAGHFGYHLLPLVEISLTLHGFCYVFFFVVGFIYVDMVAPADIRHSAQSLIGVTSMGAGLYLGSLIAGWLHDAFTYKVPLFAGGPLVDYVSWTRIFLVPCALTILCAIIFPLIFKDPRTETAGPVLDAAPEPLLEGPR